MLAASLHDRTNHAECDHITIAIDVHTAFLHADVDQELFAEPPESDEWYESELREADVWKLNKALCGYRKAPKLWHQHVVSLLESLGYHPLTDPRCFGTDELNINIFIHVDDGLLFGPRIEVVRSVELLSNQVMMRIVGRMEKLGDKIFFLCRVIERTALGYSVEANPKYFRDVIAVLGLEDSRPVLTPPTTESLGRAGELETSRVQDSRGKAVVHVSGACRHHVQRAGNSKNDHKSHRERRDEREAHREILDRCPESKVFDRDQHILPPFVNVYTDSDWAGQHQTCKSTSGGVTQW